MIGLTESHNFTLFWLFFDSLYMVTQRWRVQHPAVIYAVIEWWLSRFAHLHEATVVCFLVRVFRRCLNRWWILSHERKCYKNLLYVQYRVGIVPLYVKSYLRYKWSRVSKSTPWFPPRPTMSFSTCHSWLKPYYILEAVILRTVIMWRPSLLIDKYPTFQTMSIRIIGIGITGNNEVQSLPCISVRQHFWEAISISTELSPSPLSSILNTQSKTPWNKSPNTRPLPPSL